MTQENVLKMKNLLAGEIQPKRVYVMGIKDKLFSNTIDAVHLNIVFPAFIDPAGKRLEGVNKLPVLFSYGGEPVTIDHIRKDIEASPADKYIHLGLFVFDIGCMGGNYSKNLNDLKDIAVEYDMPVIVYHTSMKPLAVVLEDNTIQLGASTTDEFKIIENCDAVLQFELKYNTIDCVTIKNRMAVDIDRKESFPAVK